jgi:hypothetical protein
LRADVTITSSEDLMGIEGTAKIYDAKLTNFGVFPVNITVCDYLDHGGTQQFLVAYIVERGGGN